MPTYQYACTNTAGKHEFEVVQSFSDSALTECIECDAPVRKVYGSVGVVFKGSGFYRTDSRKAASASETASTGSSSNGSSSKGSSDGSSSGGSSSGGSSDGGTSGSTPAPSKSGSASSSSTPSSGSKAAS